MIYKISGDRLGSWRRKSRRIRSDCDEGKILIEGWMIFLLMMIIIFAIDLFFDRLITKLRLERP